MQLAGTTSRIDRRQKPLALPLIVGVTDIIDEDDRRPFALVVDDDVLILMDASEILADAGFRPLEAGDADDAEALLIEYADEIVLLFTDVQMPGKRDGFALARMTAERWPSIGILVASGLADPDPGLMPDGAVFLRKPFTPT